MIRTLGNLLYRSKDPTRAWRADASQWVVDVRRCTVCGTAVGGPFAGLAALGPSENARQAARGYPEWRSKGVFCVVEHGRIGDITVVLRPSKLFKPFPGRFLNDGRPIDLSNTATVETLTTLLGEPFGTSNNDWDDATVLFYEWDTGEAQFAFGNDTGTLDSVEFWYEPELAQSGACDTYGIDKVFPDQFKRTLPEKA
jgi:hypothetical protein